MSLGKLTITLLEGTHLRDTKTIARMDPYV